MRSSAAHKVVTAVSLFDSQRGTASQMNVSRCSIGKRCSLKGWRAWKSCAWPKRNRLQASWALRTMGVSGQAPAKGAQPARLSGVCSQHDPGHAASVQQYQRDANALFGQNKVLHIGLLDVKEAVGVVIVGCSLSKGDRSDRLSFDLNLPAPGVKASEFSQAVFLGVHGWQVCISMISCRS